MEQNYPTHEEIENIESIIEDAKLYARLEYWECSKHSMTKATQAIDNLINGK